ncbi:MAG TPA: hypothetical protein ACFYD4_08105 [Candidatus Wunengus sp. YC61]|uniref:hypothetical protein n=1 Tax=Candidatus Wunengus sp. YC61 TaxID=3367698 RepID=UPI0040291D68
MNIKRSLNWLATIGGTISGAVFSDLTASRGVVTDASKVLASDEAATGTGAPVRATSPTITGLTIDTLKVTTGATTGLILQSDADGDLSYVDPATAANAGLSSMTNPKSLFQSVAITAAASGSSGITVADNDNIDFGTGHFTLVWRGSLPDWTPSASQQIMHKTSSATTGYSFAIAADGTIFNYVRAGANLSYNSTVATGLVDGTVGELVVVVTRETASVAGSLVHYKNGVQLGDSVPITATTPLTLNDTLLLTVMGAGAVRTAGTTVHTYTFNRALTAAEVLDLYRNGIAESDKWASQTSIITGNDSTFAGASNWANVDINAYDETTGGVLTLTANAAGQYCTLPIANATTVANKKYRLEFGVPTLTATWTIKDFGGTVTIGTISATGTGQKIEFTASTTGGLRLVSVATTSAGTFDNFLLYEIGATLALESESWQIDKPYDASNNALTCSYPTTGWTLTRPPASRFDYPTATAKTVAATLTIAELLTLTITGTHAAGATQAYTLPTGTLCDAWPAFQTVRTFEWTLINLSAAAVDTITVTAGADHTFVGNPIVQSAHASTGGIYGNSARFRTKRTGINTFETTRIS